METRANYLMVGFFVLALALGLLGFVVWLAKFQFDQEFARYYIQYDRDVSGIKEGSPVRYQGVRVGEVASIELNPQKIGSVLMLIEIERNTPVRSDTVASLEFEGITGGKSVLLTGGAPDAVALEADPELGLPVIKAGSSTFQQVLEGAPEVLDNVNELLTRGNFLLSDENLRKVSDLLSNADALLVAGREMLGEENRELLTGVLRNAETLMDRATVLLRDENQTQITSVLTNAAGFLEQATNLLSEENQAAITVMLGQAEAMLTQAAQLMNEKNIAHIESMLANADTLLLRAAQLLDEENQNRITSLLTNADNVLARTADILSVENQEKITATLSNVESLTGRANELLNDENRENLGATIANVKEISAVLAGRSAEIEQLIVNTSVTMENLSEATGTIKELAADLREDSSRLVDRADSTLVAFETMAGSIDNSVVTVSGDVQKLITDLRGTSAALTTATGELEAMISENREPIKDFTTTGLYELTSLLVEARALVVELSRVSTEVQRDPARFIFGDQQQGYEARGK